MPASWVIFEHAFAISLTSHQLPRFYTLAASDDSVVKELREEVSQALAENDGEYSSRCLQSMKKLDSFLRETLRMNPASMGT